MIIEQIEWLDSAHSGDAWTEIDNIVFESNLISTVGYIIKEDDHNVLIGSDLVSKSVGHYTIIPKVAIINRKKLVTEESGGIVFQKTPNIYAQNTQYFPDPRYGVPNGLL